MKKLCFILTKSGFHVDETITVSEEKVCALKTDFTNAPYETLYELAFQERPSFFDMAGVFLCQIAEQFMIDLAIVPGIELSREKTDVLPSEEGMDRLLKSVPFVLGSEHVTEVWIRKQYRKLRDVFRRQIASYSETVSLYFAEKSQKLHVPERIFFHLVESKDEEYPFAFLATYATRAENGHVKHVPLQYALTEYQDNLTKLLELLSCLNRAAEASVLIGNFIDSGELFHPLRLNVEEAYQLLQDVPALEQTGILCRIPNWWRKK